MATDALTIEVKAVIEDAQKKLAQVGQDITKLGQQTLASGAAHSQAAGQGAQHGQAVTQTGTAAGEAAAQISAAGQALVKFGDDGEVASVRITSATAKTRADFDALEAKAKETAAALDEDFRKGGQAVITVGQDGTAALSRFSSATRAAKVDVEEHASTLGRFGEAAGEAKNKLTELGSKVTEAASWGLPMSNLTYGLMGGGLAIAIAGLYTIVQKTVDWRNEVAQLSTILSNNAQVASQWVGIGNEIGIQANTLTGAFLSLGKQVDQGSTVLHQMGVATQDSHGKLLSLDQDLANTQHWFQEHANSALAAERAQQLFGQAGLQLLPLLESSSTTWQQLTNELQQYGLIMDHDTLVRAREMDAEMAHAGDVAQALAINVGGPLINALAATGQAISAGIVPHLQQLRDALNAVVSFILGVIQALTGWTFQISPTAQALGNLADQTAAAGNATDTMNSQTQAAQDAQRGLREATQAQTQAIQQQINALDDQDRALQQTTDRQIAQLQLASQRENFTDSQAQAAQRLALKQQDIARLQNEYEVDLREGNLDQAMSVYDQLVQAKQDEANMEMDTTRAADDNTRQLQEESLRAQLTAVQNEHQQERVELQRQQQAIQQAATRAEEAMQGAAEAMKSGIAGAADSISGSANDMQVSISSAGTTAGQNFGDAIKDAIGGIEKFFQESDSQRQADLQKWGKTAGEAFGAGMSSGIAHSVEDFFVNLGNAVRNSPWSVLWGGPANVPMGGPNLSGYMFAEGGYVPGSYSMPVPATLHGSELVLTPSDQGQLLAWIRGSTPPAGPAPAAGPGAVNATFNVYGATDPRAVVAVVRTEMAAIMGVR